MNHFSKKTTAVLLCLLVTACGGKSQVAGGESIVEEAFVLPTSADYEVPPVADYNIDIMLRNDAIDRQLIKQESLPAVTFTVWGFDDLAADVAATEIHKSEFPLRPQSVPYPLRFDESVFQSIEFQSGRPEAVKYYITFGVDVDGDGGVCNGDFRQDYSLSAPERFPLAVANVSQSIEIIEVSGEICTQ